MKWGLARSAIILALISINLSCQPSERISFIHDIRTCNDSNLTVSFNLTDADCTHYGYHIVVIHNVSQTEKPSKQLPIPYRYNGTNICHFFLTLDDTVTADEFHDSRLQIRIYNNSSPLLCSNYFRILVDEDPPSPIIVSSTINCTGVYIDWSPPFSPPGCPIDHYILSYNNSSIITNETSYSLTGIAANKRISVAVGAVNDIGTSWNYTVITTAIFPNVSIMNNSIQLLPMITNQTNVTAYLNITATVFAQCVYSFPTRLIISVSCNDNYEDYSSVSVTQTNGLIVYSKELPIDMIHCTANVTWSNIKFSTAQDVFYFNTTQLYMIQLFPVPNGLNYTCQYREHSNLWGCGISVASFDNSIERDVTEGHLDVPCSGFKEHKGMMRTVLLAVFLSLVGLGLIALIIIIVLIVAFNLRKRMSRSKTVDMTVAYNKGNNSVVVAANEEVVFDSSVASGGSTEIQPISVQLPVDLDHKSVIMEQEGRSDELPQYTHPESEIGPHVTAPQEDDETEQLLVTASHVTFKRDSIPGRSAVFTRQDSGQSNKSLASVASSVASALSAKITEKVGSIPSLLSFGGKGYHPVSQKDLSTIQSEANIHDTEEIPDSTNEPVVFVVAGRGGGDDDDDD